MKKIFTIVLLVCCGVLGWAQTVVFVSADGNDNNNGSSWATAKKTIAAGITAANGNGTVYVMVGEYAISAQFVIPSGVLVKGGYSLASSGTDTTKRELPGTNNRWENASVCTIISGAGNHRIASVSGLLEGCVVRWGYHSSQGGGVLIDGGTVRYCVIRECDAYNESALTAEGGGAYILNGGTLTNSVVTECRADKGPAVSGGNGSLINNTITRNYPTHCGTVADYDGNIYNTVVIGQQCWTKQNIRTTHYNDGTAIPFGTDTSTTQPYYYVNYAGVSPQTLENYGYLYNWRAAMHGASSSNSNPSGVTGICPLGWHVPSDAEWTEMTDFVNSHTYFRCNGYDEQIAKALASASGWSNSTNNCDVGNNQGGNNKTLFSVYPGGSYGGNNTYNFFGNETCFWSATAYYLTYVWLRNMNNTYSTVRRYFDEKFYGLSVRCVKQMESSVPIVHTKEIIDADIYSTYAIAGGSCGDAGDPITAYGVCWSTSPNPTINDDHTTDGSGEATFTTQISGLTLGQTYYVRAYAINSIGVSYGEERTFTTDDCLEVTVTDYDGNVYHTVKLGTQCWTKENMRATHYSDGSNYDGYCCFSYSIPNGSTDNVATYGYLYSWHTAARNNTSSSIPSGVQGICPTGWHLPSKAEWLLMRDHVRGADRYFCGSDSNNTAKALASTTNWNYCTYACSVGDVVANNNATGFSAMPAGRNSIDLFNTMAFFWCSTVYYYDHYNYANYFSISHCQVSGPLEIGSFRTSDNYRCSVRCVRD